MEEFGKDAAIGDEERIHLDSRDAPRDKVYHEFFFKQLCQLSVKV